MPTTKICLLILGIVAPLMTACPAKPVTVNSTAAQNSRPPRMFTSAEFQTLVVEPACVPLGERCMDAASTQLKGGANLREIVVKMCSAAQHPANMRGATPGELACYQSALKNMADEGLLSMAEKCKSKNRQVPQQAFCIRQSMTEVAKNYPVKPL